MGLVSTRSVAESVFVSQLLRTIREANLYIIPLQNICTGPELLQLPSRQSKKPPVDFISPVVVSVVDLLKQIQPVRQDGLALRRVQSLEAQLKEAQAKLAEAEAGKLTSVRSASSPARSAGHKRDSSALGSTPKRRAKARATPPQASGQPKLATVFASQTKTSSASPRNVEEDHISEFSDEKSPITVQELMQTSGPTLKKSLQQFPVETQQEATKFAKMFQDAAVLKAKLQEAAIQYGLPIEQSLKFPPRGLQQLIAIAAALTA